MKKIIPVILTTIAIVFSMGTTVSAQTTTRDNNRGTHTKIHREVRHKTNKENVKRNRENNRNHRNTRLGKESRIDIRGNFVSTKSYSRRDLMPYVNRGFLGRNYDRNQGFNREFRGNNFNYRLDTSRGLPFYLPNMRPGFVSRWESIKLRNNDRRNSNNEIYLKFRKVYGNEQLWKDLYIQIKVDGRLVYSGRISTAPTRVIVSRGNFRSGRNMRIEERLWMPKALTRHTENTREFVIFDEIVSTRDRGRVTLEDRFNESNVFEHENV